MSQRLRWPSHRLTPLSGRDFPYRTGSCCAHPGTSAMRLPGCLLTELRSVRPSRADTGSDFEARNRAEEVPGAGVATATKGETCAPGRPIRRVPDDAAPESCMTREVSARLRDKIVVPSQEPLRCRTSPRHHAGPPRSPPNRLARSLPPVRTGSSPSRRTGGRRSLKRDAGRRPIFGRPGMKVGPRSASANSRRGSLGSGWIGREVSGSCR